MSREIKFKYIWKRETSIATGVYTLKDIENGNCVAPKTKGINWDVIERLQYTGLKDKNGVEIYEGDIVSGISRVFGSINGCPCMSEYLDNEEYMHETHLGWNVCGIPLLDLVNDGLTVTSNTHKTPN